MLINKCSENSSLTKNVQNCNAEEKLLMLTNGGHLCFNQTGELLLLPLTFHINESSMANIIYFAKGSSISGVHIKMDTSKEKVINVHTKCGKIINFKSYAEGIFYTNLNCPSMITNPTNVSFDTDSYLSVV